MILLTGAPTRRTSFGTLKILSRFSLKRLLLGDEQAQAGAQESLARLLQRILEGFLKDIIIILFFFLERCSVKWKQLSSFLLGLARWFVFLSLFLCRRSYFLRFTAPLFCLSLSLSLSLSLFRPRINTGNGGRIHRPTRTSDEPRPTASGPPLHHNRAPFSMKTHTHTHTHTYTHTPLFIGFEIH